MKIAFITDDGVTISQHFGRAGKYLVVEIEDGKELSRDMRDKLGHTHFRQAEPAHNHAENQAHNNPADHSKHVQMMDAIEDCDVVVCGGMGRGAFQSIVSLGKEVFMTNTDDINNALKGYLAGELQNMSDLIH
ncbi:MAG: NifB/NifX family molybdenum-iron cluster-binding protein [Pelolinea sp.]|nr:NifB/NifX family molybdenum-iron cluster-binding protein [Pelolinea sp.]